MPEHVIPVYCEQWFRMKKFKELFHDKVKLRIRFSLDNLKLDDDVLNIPLLMADQAERLIGLTLEKMEH